MASEPTPEQSYCADEARRNDWDRFICTLFAPADLREALFTLIAFNGELARTRDVVSQPLLGQIRLQWWRDALAAIYGEMPPSSATATHPILVPLSRAISRHRLDRGLLDAMIDARSDELEDNSFADEGLIATYIRATSGSLARLQAGILSRGEPVPDATLSAIDHVAMGWGLIELVRMGRLSPDRRDSAREHIARARSEWSQIERRYLSVLLPATLADSLLIAPQAGRARRQIKLAFNALRGRF